VRERIARACAAVGRDPAAVALLAVSKGRDAASVREALAAGQREFGENRVQELVAKAGALADQPLRWHLIGSLQTNKVDALLGVPGLALVHSLDRVKLADALQRALDERGRELDVLLQIDATDDADKHGARPDHARALLAHVRAHCPRLRVRGLMAMGPRQGSPKAVFAAVAALRDELAARGSLPLPVLSLGMTGDLEDAIAAGSTLVRVGTAIFGSRSPERFTVERFTVERMTDERDWEAVRALRAAVFIVEQGCPPEEEWDGFDASSVHFIGRCDGAIVATARTRPYGAFTKLERFAVARTHRGRGLGRTLVAAVIGDARRAGRALLLHAQAHLEGFYRSFGFEVVGEPFDEAGIPHVRMTRKA
jgi:pyridoxal phosphate enzyme (YggS family)